jgi:pimeloyl-ACP methyl ester carboxylesterase
MPAYLPRRLSRSQFLPVRGLNYHVRTWDALNASPDAPLIILLHGWMDVSASFQFLLDALPPAFDRFTLLAPDWRGYGLTDNALDNGSGYWFQDYLADLESLLNQLSPDRPIILVGHSLGGNIACIYAGLRPNRISQLISLDGFGMRSQKPSGAVEKITAWLDGLKTAPQLRPYASLADVAARLQKNNPRLSEAKAAYLAEHWSKPTADGQYALLADPQHKLPFPTLYRLEEAISIWQAITAPTLWLGARESEIAEWLGYAANAPEHKQAEFASRKAAVASLRFEIIEGAGHMLHHEQAETVAAAVASFIAT